MAVLIEAISVVTRRDAVDERFDGGWNAFIALTPNRTLCWDESLMRVGFMEERHCRVYLNALQQRGLVLLESRKAKDVVVVDQFQGPLWECDWVEFARLPLGDDGGEVAAAWLFEGKRLLAGRESTLTAWNSTSPLQPGGVTKIHSPRPPYSSVAVRPPHASAS